MTVRTTTRQLARARCAWWAPIAYLDHQTALVATAQELAPPVEGATGRSGRPGRAAGQGGCAAGHAAPARPRPRRRRRRTRLPGRVTTGTRRARRAALRAARAAWRLANSTVQPGDVLATSCAPALRPAGEPGEFRGGPSSAAAPRNSSRRPRQVRPARPPTRGLHRGRETGRTRRSGPTAGHVQLDQLGAGDIGPAPRAAAHGQRRDADRGEADLDRASTVPAERTRPSLDVLPRRRRASDPGGVSRTRSSRRHSSSYRARRRPRPAAGARRS